MQAILDTCNTTLLAVKHDEGRYSSTHATMNYVQANVALPVVADVIREEVSQFLRCWPPLSAWHPSSVLQTDSGGEASALMRFAAEYRHPVLEHFLEEPQLPLDQKSTHHFLEFLCGKQPDVPVDGQMVLEIAETSKRRDVAHWARTYGCLRPRKDEDTWYKIVGIKVHASKTCLVIFAVQVQTKEQVCLKFMSHKDQWEREIEMRQNTDGTTLSRDHVVPLLAHFQLDEEARAYCDGHNHLRGEAGVSWTHLLSMPQAERDLSDLLSHDRVAGHDLSTATMILHQVALHLQYFHVTCGRMHGDLKARNIVKITIGNVSLWLLIDLDASCSFKSPAGQKVTSSANFPPEMARYELQKKLAKAGCSTPPVPLEATVAFEIYYFGMLIFQLCTLDSETVFRANQADNLVDWEIDSEQLAYHMEARKLEVIQRILRSNNETEQGWTFAADLALWCMQPRADRRPQNIQAVLDHRFFNTEGELRFLSGPHDTFSLAIVRWSKELHSAIERNDPDAVSRLFGKGCVHYSLCLKGDDLTAAQKSISPLQRAARYGHLSIVRIVLDEVLHPQALPAVLDATTHYDHTALHWSAVFNHALVAAELIRRGCDTAVLNHRGKTAWEVAEACGSADVMAVFESCASSPSPLDSRAPSSLHEESIRRARRPDVKDTFRDDIQLDPARLDFWSLKPFDRWKLLGDGMYGKVFGTQADPAVQVGDRRFCKLALKVPKQIGAEELKGEVESLSQLSHENVVQILGMMHGKTKGSGEEKQWALALEWCESDLTNLLYKPEAADPDGIYKPLPKMCELMEQIAQGLAYIHARQRPHLDLKPDNILLAKAAAGRYVAKLADFGMAYERKQLQAVGDGSAGDTGGSAPKTPQEIDPEKIAPFGTWEYISPSVSSASMASRSSSQTFSASAS
eukprot:COSAG06_NODE_621_length_13727_cov_26.487893_3_plen_912_part_00